MRTNPATAKVSISLPEPSLAFVESFRETHKFASRSEVIDHAIRLLRERSLESSYAAASLEDDGADWESTAADGLADETW